MTSPSDPALARRALVVQWARSMPVADLDAAMPLLCRQLLSPDEKAPGTFRASSTEYEAANTLPDLRIDPRKRGA